MAENKTPVSITGDFTTPDATPDYAIPLVVNGAAATSPIPVPAGTEHIISDVAVCGGSGAEFRLQQDNGGGFFDIGLFAIPGLPVSPTRLYTTRIGWTIAGGASVAFRMLTTTPGGATRVTVTLRGYVSP